MTKAEELFHKIADGIPDTTEGKMFGALCIKAPNGKAGVMYWKDYMIFKLDPDAEKEVLSLDGAKIFEPSPGKKMGGWVQLSYDHSKRWPKLAKQAMDFVKTIKK